MKLFSRNVLPAIVAACALGSSVADAGSTYQFTFDQASYQVDPGAQVLVNVYLQEQVSDGSASVLATEGLIGAGVRVSFDQSSLPSDPARITGVGNILLNDGPGAFSGGFQSAEVAPGSYAQLMETVDSLSAPVHATNLGVGLFRILIGTFRFTAGQIAGQTTWITAGDIPDSSDLITGGGVALDSLVTPGRASIEVRSAVGAVPEPSGLIGLTIGILGTGGYAVARRRGRAVS
jgi:hypothetical protein